MSILSRDDGQSVISSQIQDCLNKGCLSRALETSKTRIESHIASIERILDNRQWTTSQKDVGYVLIVMVTQIHTQCRNSVLYTITRWIYVDGAWNYGLYLTLYGERRRARPISLPV